MMVENSSAITCANCVRSTEYDLLDLLFFEIPHVNLLHIVCAWFCRLSRVLCCDPGGTVRSDRRKSDPFSAAISARYQA